MKKLLIAVFSLMIVITFMDYILYYQKEYYIKKEVTSVNSKAEDGMLYIKDQSNQFEVFDIRGVNLGLGKPEAYATEYAITKDEYLRWFSQIQDLGANTIRIYTLSHPEFYEAFYEYNKDNPNPLYLIHGVWVDDYLLNSTNNAFDEVFYEDFFKEIKNVVDVIHGKHQSFDQTEGMADVYNKDISEWVYGYILGVEWEENLVAYTDFLNEGLAQFKGEYFETTDANPFEIFLAMSAETVAKYESEKYGTQSSIALSNWAITDPFEYEEIIDKYFNKIANVDVEKIKPTTNFEAAYYASYHIYPYYPSYHSVLEDLEDGAYLHYLNELNTHHQIPVVISEFGVPTSRALASIEDDGGRNQGMLSEQEQGLALVTMYDDIIESGSAGGIVFSWQDEWFKRTWNTMAHTDLNQTAYWSDIQTNEQNFGLLTFEPGKEQSIVYVDDSNDEWNDKQLVTTQDGLKLYMDYDVEGLYFMIEADSIDLDETYYITLDTTPNSGSTYSKQHDLEMGQPTDFIIEIDGKDNSRVLVHERYDIVDGIYSNIVHFNRPEVPAKDSENFESIELMLQENRVYFYGEDGEYHEIGIDEVLDYENIQMKLKTYETGRLIYGNGNPKAEDFNSLTDFSSGEDYIEVRIPWGLINFSNPTSMEIHDDYYDNYGVEPLKINSIQVGVGQGDSKIEMVDYKLKPTGMKNDYHERLKESYYVLQERWKESSR